MHQVAHLLASRVGVVAGDPIARRGAERRDDRDPRRFTIAMQAGSSYIELSPLVPANGVTMQHDLQLRAVANGEGRRASLALVRPGATLSLASAVTLTGGVPRRKNGDPLRFRVRDEADRVDDAGHSLEMLNRERRTLRPIRRQGGSEFQAAAASRDRRDGSVWLKPR